MSSRSAWICSIFGNHPVFGFPSSVSLATASTFSQITDDRGAGSVDSVWIGLPTLSCQVRCGRSNSNRPGGIYSKCYPAFSSPGFCRPAGETPVAC